MFKKLYKILKSTIHFYQVVDNVYFTHPHHHLLSKLCYASHFICQSITRLFVCIKNNDGYYEQGIVNSFTKFLFAQKDVSNNYEYHAFYTNKRIFILGKNRFIPQCRSGSFCPKPWPGAVKSYLFWGCFVKKIKRFT